MHRPTVRALLAPVVALLLLWPAGPSAAGPLAARAAREARWSWPVPLPHRVVRGFEAPASRWGAGHRGLGLAAAVGSPVTAPDDGVVAFAGTVVDRGVVSIDEGGGVRATLEPVVPRVAAGAAVRRGQVVAVVATGGDHDPGVLHLGARLQGEYVSPLLYLGAAPHAVLLPLAAFTAS